MPLVRVDDPLRPEDTDEEGGYAGWGIPTETGPVAVCHGRLRVEGEYVTTGASNFLPAY